MSKGEIGSTLVRETASYSLYSGPEAFSTERLREEVRFLFNRWGHILEAVNKDVSEIHLLAKKVETEYWLTKLQDYYKNTDKRGHKAELEDFKVLLWGCAGRVMMTIQDSKPQGKGKYGGAWVSLIFDETSTEPRGGIQGLCATKEEALGLLQAALDSKPDLKPNEEVTLLGV